MYAYIYTYIYTSIYLSIYLSLSLSLYIYIYIYTHETTGHSVETQEFPTREPVPCRHTCALTYVALTPASSSAARSARPSRARSSPERGGEYC